MDSSKIKPAAGGHAIEVVAIGIEWVSPLNVEALTALEDLYRASPELHGFLPSFAPLRSVLLQMGAQVSAAGVAGVSQPGFIPQNQPAGFDLRRFESNGSVPWVVSVRPEFISVNSTVYDRWATVKPKALELLDKFVTESVKRGQQISAIGLQYQDGFEIEGDITPEKMKSLFRGGSAWMPSHVLEESSFWHCHQGWFSKSPKGRRVLNNVNVDVVESPNGCSAKINGQHRVFSIAHNGKEAHPIFTSDIEQALDFLHSENKRVLGGLLTDEILDIINLKIDAGDKK